MAKCGICEKPTSGSLEFCGKHYQMYKEEIKDKKPWVRAIKNDMQRERRRKEREIDTTSLDAIMDRYIERKWD